MNRPVIKKISVLLLCLSVLAGTMSISGCGSAVNTYNVSNIAYVDSWMSTSESYGEVRTYNMQNIYLTESMQINEIFVTEGQEVKKGDKLVAYDTALTRIELEKKELEVMQKQLELKQAENELKTINSYKPMVITTVVPSASDVTGTKITGYLPMGGSGTEESPYIFAVEDGKIPCSDSFMSAVCSPGTEKVWVVFQQRAGNMTNGKIVEYWGVCYSAAISGTTMSFFDASKFSQNIPTEPYEEIEFNSGFTASDISRMRAAAKERIKQADYEYRLADVEYRQMQLEMDNGVVYAEIDGTIVSVAEDQQMAMENGAPLVKLSNNGGYMVQGSLSELELGTVSVGQTVKVTSWENYGEYEAEIAEISTIPTTQNGWTNGNNNVSYYPFTVYIDGSANLKEYEYVSVTYNSKGEQQSDSLYIERAFVLDENGRSYIFVQNEEGKVEKRAVETGEILWGSYVRIVSGLTVDDRIAFPYDKNAKDGAKAREAEIDELYMQ